MIGKRLENEESAAPFHYGDHIIDAACASPATPHAIVDASDGRAHSCTRCTALILIEAASVSRQHSLKAKCVKLIPVREITFHTFFIAAQDQI